MNIEAYEKLPLSFYLRSNVVVIAQDLVGKVLFSQVNGKLTAGTIIETEAYDGRRDKACHAFGRRTERTEVMYQKGGRAYIYLCYGIHHLFNIVTNEMGLADAVLIRALEPIHGEDVMESRRDTTGVGLSNGPGSLSQAMGFRREMTGASLTGEEIWLARDINDDESFTIEADRRVGVDYAKEDAALPWRFFIKDHPYLSKRKQKPWR
ncbi:MAG: DNA-3-methyladenine glycosylase [Cyclobacteriaceae bacterium]|nr:DNA-3-methyladenine glycosylase [Cyclobacteriaceae bacterium HetDA_MAG_MS6]